MLTYNKRIDLARRFVADANITDDPAADIGTFYIVEDISEVIDAYANDLENIEGVYDNTPEEIIFQTINDNFIDESIGRFFKRYNINYK